MDFQTDLLPVRKKKRKFLPRTCVKTKAFALPKKKWNYPRWINLFAKGVIYSLYSQTTLLVSPVKPLNQHAGPRGLSDLRWCWTALPSTLFSCRVISVLRPQQTVTLYLMLWKWRGGGASPRCLTEAETRVLRTDRNKDRHGLSHRRTQGDLWRALTALSRSVSKHWLKLLIGPLLRINGEMTDGVVNGGTL